MIGGLSIETGKERENEREGERERDSSKKIPVGESIDTRWEYTVCKFPNCWSRLPKLKIETKKHSLLLNRAFDTLY